MRVPRTSRSGVEMPLRGASWASTGSSRKSWQLETDCPASRIGPQAGAAAGRNIQPPDPAENLVHQRRDPALEPSRPRRGHLGQPRSRLGNAQNSRCELGTWVGDAVEAQPAGTSINAWTEHDFLHFVSDREQLVGSRLFREGRARTRRTVVASAKPGKSRNRLTTACSCDRRSIGIEGRDRGLHDLSEVRLWITGPLLARDHGDLHSHHLPGNKNARVSPRDRGKARAKQTSTAMPVRCF